MSIRDEILEAIGEMVVPPLSPDDVTVDMIRREYGISKTMAYGVMDKLAASGEYTLGYAKDPGNNNVTVKVIRKRKDTEDDDGGLQDSGG